MSVNVRTSVELDATGGVAVVKRPCGPVGEASVRRETLMLEAARHPGVVDLLATVDSTGAPAVHTRWVGPRTLAATGDFDIAHVAGTLSAVADIVADLHEIGLVHGGLQGDHVIRSRVGRPVLCSFGHSAWSTDDGPCATDDVAPLGQMLRELVGDVEPEPIPGRRGRRRRPGSWHPSNALLNLADQATADQASARPTARLFAAAIHQLMPDARLPPAASDDPFGSGLDSEASGVDGTAADDNRHHAAGPRLRPQGGLPRRLRSGLPIRRASRLRPPQGTQLRLRLESRLRRGTR